jgi:predicted double-glycine peptidase
MVQKTIDVLATTAARLEALTHPDAIILPHFPSSIQLDSLTCGAKSVYCILRYYGKRCTPKSVEKELKTDSDGTAVSDIKRVFKRYHLNCRTLRKPRLKDLVEAIDNGYPIIVSLHFLEHHAVVYGFSSGYIFVMNPSLDFTEDGVGNLWCAVRKDRFRRIWDRWGIVVSSLK